MTSEEIKKAFDICCDIQGCTGCPILELGEQNGCGCKHNLFVSAIDLITEQEKEIDGLKAENVRLKEENANLLKVCEEKFTFDTTQNNKYSIFNTVRKLAVQDFADKLKGKLQDFGDGGEKGAYITEKDIDELLRGYEK